MRYKSKKTGGHGVSFAGSLKKIKPFVAEAFDSVALNTGPTAPAPQQPSGPPPTISFADNAPPPTNADVKKVADGQESIAAALQALNPQTAEQAKPKTGGGSVAMRLANAVNPFEPKSMAIAAIGMMAGMGGSHLALWAIGAATAGLSSFANQHAHQINNTKPFLSKGPTGYQSAAAPAPTTSFADMVAPLSDAKQKRQVASLKWLEQKYTQQANNIAAMDQKPSVDLGYVTGTQWGGMNNLTQKAALYNGKVSLADLGVDTDRLGKATIKPQNVPTWTARAGPSPIFR